jgi:Spy/CpxP family protein refolding chaperone
MKIFLLALALTAAIAPATLHAQTNRLVERPELQRLREELRDMTPEQRQEKIRELRERGGLPEGGQRPGQPPGQPGGFGGRGAGIERIAAVLTPEQRDSLREVTIENRQQMTAIENKIRDARKAALDAALESPINDADLRAKLDAVAKLEAEIAFLRVKSFAKMEPPLSDEQKQQIKNPPQMNDAARAPQLRRPMMDQPGEVRPGDKLDLPPPQ